MPAGNVYPRCRQPKPNAVNTLSTVLVTLVIIVALLFGAFILVGPARIWRLTGDPDLGPVVFKQLERSSAPNDALACPPEFCEVPSEITSPSYTVSAEFLRAVFSDVLATQPNTTVVARDDESMTDRYIQRSRLLQFPDTINIQYIALTGQTSSVAMYSRSQLGYSDLGANQQRLERWIDALNTRLSSLEAAKSEP